MELFLELSPLMNFQHVAAGSAAVTMLVTIVCCVVIVNCAAGT